MEKSIIYKNLKFWGSHTAINAIPSFIIALAHDWDTPAAIVGMLIGIALFAFLLVFFTSLPSSQKIIQHPIVSTAIKVGTITRSLICLLPILLLLLATLFQLFFSTHSYNGITLDGLYAADFFAGIVSHDFYRAFVDLLPFHISDSRLFLPTVVITIIQGFIMTGILLTIGLFLSPLVHMRRNRAEQARL